MLRLPFTVLLSLLLVVAASCTSQTSVQEQEEATEPLTQESAPPPRLLVSGASGDIRVLDSNGDAVAERRPDSSAFRQPTFTSDGAVLAVETQRSGGSALVLLSQDDLSVLSRVEVASPPFYYHPRQDGPFASTSLRNNPSGGLVVEELDSAGVLSPISTASPYYTSWEPGGDRIATHVATQRLEIRSADGTVEIAIEDTGVYQAPSWTEEGVITLRTVDSQQRLSLWTDAGVVDIASVDGPVQFVARNSRVAIQSLAQPAPGVQTSVLLMDTPEIPVGRLTLLDLSSGAIETISTGVAVYFEWDPAGDRLLYAVIDDASTAMLRWAVWQDGSSTDFGSFEASPTWIREVAPFFDQYVQSAPLWSPDGLTFAYPTMVDEVPTVILQSLDGSAVSVDDAVWVTWSR
ncbi:MAG: hypothetical protein ACR2N2_08350 [Acidimicrobiia bacterium]